jgi:acetyl esterase/lipase
LPLRWYSKDGASPGSAAVYLHGGGMILGNLGLFDATLARCASASGVPILGVDYRLAPEHPYPAAVEDAYAAVQWLVAEPRRSARSQALGSP